MHLRAATLFVALALSDGCSEAYNAWPGPYDALADGGPRHDQAAGDRAVAHLGAPDLIVDAQPALDQGTPCSGIWSAMTSATTTTLT